jgi:hypothetical protein
MTCLEQAVQAVEYGLRRSALRVRLQQQDRCDRKPLAYGEEFRSLRSRGTIQFGCKVSLAISVCGTGVRPWTSLGNSGFSVHCEP